MATVDERRVPAFALESMSAMDAVERLLAVADRVLEASRSSPAEWRRAFESLTRGQRMLYAVHKLEMTVNSDGFTHYFFYDGADTLPEAAQGLREFGAPEGVGRALHAAARLFTGGSPPADWNEREDAVQKLEERVKDPFGPMDRLFFDSCAGCELIALAMDYVRRRPGAFFIDGA